MADDDLALPALSAVCRLAQGLLGDGAAAVVQEGVGPVAGAGLAGSRVEAAVLVEATAQALARGDLLCVPSEEAGAVAPVLSLLAAMGSAVVGFCVAVPLTAESLQGALVLLAAEPRPLCAAQRAQLADLALIAGAQLRLEAQKRSAEARAELFGLLVENSTDVLARGDSEGTRLYVSPAIRTVLGYAPEEIQGTKAVDNAHPEDTPEFRQMMQDLLEGRLHECRTEQRHRHKNGSWIWVEALVRLTRDKLTGAPNGYVASVRDISRRKAAELRLADLAARDALTGLANRVLLHERLEAEVDRARCSGMGVVVLCLDLDRFKPVNDTWGHEAGDAVLRAAAARFEAAAGNADMVARLGGDEFVILLGADPDPRRAGEVLAARLIGAMREPVDIDGQPVTVGLSIGIAVALPLDLGADLSPDRLLREGDKALYAAKEGGRNRSVVTLVGGSTATR